MKIHFLTILTILTILPILTFPPPAFAAIKKSGDIEIITDEPLYPSSIVWYPGFSQQKSFQVKNRGNSTKTVQIESISEQQLKGLAGILAFEVREGGKTLYGTSPNKTMQNFFDDGTISLSDVPVDDNGKIYDMIVTMPLSTGNEYQEGKATFDLRVGFPEDAQSSVIITSTSVEPSPTPTPSLVLGGRTTAVGEQELVLGEEVTPSPTPSVEEITPTSTPAEGSVFGTQTTGIDLRWILVGGILLLGGALFLLWWRGNRGGEGL